MDYKEIARMLNWIVKNAKLTGAEARLLIMMATECNYKTGEFSSGYQDMADELKLSKQSIISATDRLEKLGAIKTMEKPTGKRPTVYKIRSMDDLILIHAVETVNPEWEKWKEKKMRIFGNLERKLDMIGAGCQECFKDESEEMCDQHKDELKRLMRTNEGKEMTLWESDNPKPDFKIMMVEFMK